MRIPGRYTRTVLLRGVFLWAAARVGVYVSVAFISSMAMSDMVGSRDLLTGANPIVSAWTMALSATLMLIDVYRRHEVMLLNNLGVATASVVMLGAVPAIVIEASLMVVLR